MDARDDFGEDVRNWDFVVRMENGYCCKNFGEDV